MASLTGDLSLLPFSDLLQLLVSNKRLGTLTVLRGKDQKAVHIGERGFKLVSTTTRRTNSLGEILLRTKKITRDQLDQLLQLQKNQKIRLGELVQKEDLITPEILKEALREQAEEEIYELFTWNDARFEFEDGPPPPITTANPMAVATVKTHPASIMLEAARRADELHMIRSVVPDDSNVVFKTNRIPEFESLGMDPNMAQAVYRCINGERTVEQVIQISLYPAFDAMRALYLLARSGGIKILDEKGATAVREKIKTRRFVRQQATSEPEPPAAPGAKTLALLGDLITYRSALASLLRGAGYDIIEESAAGVARLLTGDRKIDAVLMDVGLDSPKGYDFCTWLSENIKAPIVVLASDPSKEAALNAVGAGASNYVVKPFTRETILKSLEGALSVSPTS